MSTGESVTVTVCPTEQETAALLATVLDGDHTAASLLARAIHQNPATVDSSTDGLTVPLSPSELGIWIDPIGELVFFFVFKAPSVFVFHTVLLLLFLIQTPPASTSRAGRRFWRRVTCRPQVCTVLWF